MPVNNNAGFQVIFHARESLRKRGRSEAEIQKILTIMRENLLDSPSNILDISQETWLSLNLPVGLLLELRRAAFAAGCKPDEGHEVGDAKKEGLSTDGNFTEESFPLTEEGIEKRTMNFTGSPNQHLPDTFQHSSSSSTPPLQHHWSRGATMHAGRKDTGVPQFKSGYKKWSNGNFSKDFHHHQASHYRGPPHKRVRLRPNDGSPSIGNSKTEIVDCRTWMPPSQVKVNESYQHDTPVLLNRATEAGEAAATLALQQEENNETPPGQPSATGYWGSGRG